MLTDLVLSSEVENLVVDVQDRAALIIQQEFLVPPNYRHIELTIRGEDFQPVLLPLPDFNSELCLMAGIVRK